MTSLAEIVSRVDATTPVTVPESWTQGRTAYGGLTAALSVVAARQAVGDDAPPLRSAHFAFTAPAVDSVSITGTVLRQGRSVTSVSVQATSQGQVAAQSTVVLARPRPSGVVHDLLLAPDVPDAESCPPFADADAPRPAFAANFDIRRAAGDGPLHPGGPPRYVAWVRHRDAVGVDPLIALIALGDALPPAATAVFESWAPVSTITWDVHMCRDDLADATGWFLIETDGDHAEGGYSHQTMRVFDAERRVVMVATQTVAVFA
ncbi:MAG: thioesterase family protein [Gordonia paraffinivorans]